MKEMIFASFGLFILMNTIIVCGLFLLDKTLVVNDKKDVRCNNAVVSNYRLVIFSIYDNDSLNRCLNGAAGQ